MLRSYVSFYLILFLLCKKHSPFPIPLFHSYKIYIKFDKQLITSSNLSVVFTLPTSIWTSFVESLCSIYSSPPASKQVLSRVSYIVTLGRLLISVDIGTKELPSCLNPRKIVSSIYTIAQQIAQYNKVKKEAYSA